MFRIGRIYDDMRQRDEEAVLTDFYALGDGKSIMVKVLEV
jgi:hypothetical protein